MSAELRHLHILQFPTHQSSVCLWTVGRADREWAVPAQGMWGSLGREETGGKRQNIPDMFPFSCFFRCLSRLVCWPKHLSHKWHLNGFSLLWMLRTCLCRLEDMLKDLSQYLHLKITNKTRKEFVSSWKCKICPKIYEEPSGLSLSTNPSFLFPTEAPSSLA